MLIVSPILTFLTVAYRAPSSVKNASVLAISIRIGIIYLSLSKYLKRIIICRRNCIHGISGVHETHGAAASRHHRTRITFDCRARRGLIASIVSACRCEWALIWARGWGSVPGDKSLVTAAGKLSLSVGRRRTWEAADKMPSLFAAESLAHCIRGNGRRGRRITKKTLMRRENVLNERLCWGLRLMKDWC